MKRSQIKKIVHRVTEAKNARSKDSARNWKQGDDLDFDYSDEDMFPDEIQDFMSAEEKEMYLDDDEPEAGVSSPGTYTLDDIVDTQVLRTRSPAGTKGWVDGTLRTMKDLMTNDELSEALMEIKEDQKTFDDFAEARDQALGVWTPSATKILGQDASKLPELSDNMFLNGFLYDIWFMSTFIKPLERQADKGKDLPTSLKSVHERWKYMTTPNRVKDMLKKVITPAFEFLTRDTSVAG